MKTETLKKIEQMEAELKALKESINKPEFEVGKWYKFEYGLVCYTGKDYGYGFWNNGRVEWHNEIRFDGICKAERLATRKEVKKALIAEAEKRGFKEGDKINSFYADLEPYGRSYRLDTTNYKYDELEDSLFSEGDELRVYCKGQWAEIIKDEVITICGKEVEFKEGGIIQIGCSCFSHDFLLSAKMILDSKYIPYINVGFPGSNDKVTLETINKILDRLK